jgi:type 1 glutamine amidotransferase
MVMRNCWFVAVVVVMVSSVGITSTGRAETVPRALLITGLGNKADPGHLYNAWDHDFYNDAIARTLDGIAEVTVTDNLSLLNDSELEAYDIILNNSVLLEPTQDQQDAFYRFIESGKAYLSLHAGMVSFLNSERYNEMMGGSMIGHDEFKSFRVMVFDDWYGFDYTGQVRHPVTRGVSNFTTDDELYLVQMNTADLDVIARGESHPIMWWRHWGGGKVMALTLGHGEVSVDNDGYRTLLRNGVRWLLGYPLVEPIRDGVFPVSSEAVDDFVDLNEVSSHVKDGLLRFTLQNNSNPGLITAAIDQRNRLSLHFAPGESGSATIVVRAEDDNGLSTDSGFDVVVRQRGSGNLARYFGTAVLASSNEIRMSTGDPRRVIDGDFDTRWSSDYLDRSWIYVDLGDSYPVDRVRLFWEGAFATEYELQVSNDTQDWRTVHSETSGDGGTDDITFKPVSARYVRMHGTKRATRWGHSLYEFEVYASAAR